VTTLPFVGFLVAIWHFWGRGISLLDAGLLLGLYFISGLGVTIGFHRLLTHQSFEAPEWVRVALAVAGSLAIEGAVISWVADHRRHHAFADKPGDPHSPHLDEAEGVRGVLRGLWHAHIGWFFDPEKTRKERFAPDLLKERPLRIVSALFPLWVVVSLAIAPAVAFALTRSMHAAFTAVIWGSLVRVFFLHHVTWSINSICHFYGKRPYKSGDESTNNLWMSLVSFGEGWHNNHHAFPNSAFHGLGRWEIDISGILIRAMSRLRIIRNPKVPTLDQRLAKRLPAG
ncbi:MAG: acyl-CoA desaturase, partial [Gaiellales bacterium]